MFLTKTRTQIIKNNLNNIDWKAVGLSPDKLNRHFEKHAEELGLKTVEEYDNFAKEFMNKEIKDNIKGFVSKDGYVFKYDEENNIFGDAKPNGITETVFKPKRKKAYWKEQVENKRKCMCCGEYTLDEDDLFAICNNCGWESDKVQEDDPNYKGGANEMSLNEAKEAYKKGIKIN